MLKDMKSKACFLLAMSLVSMQSFAGAPPRALSFGDGSLLALGAACAVGAVWILRNKKK